MLASAQWHLPNLRLTEKFCHEETRVNVNSLVRATFAVPPSGGMLGDQSAGSILAVDLGLAE